MGVDHMDVAIKEILAKDVRANERQLGQQVENQNHPFMRYLATLDEPDLEALAKRLGMSVGVLRCAQKAADQLETLQTAFVNRHKEGELHDNHSAQFKSWGRFAVFDSLMSRMTDEIEFEAVRRTRNTSKSPTNIRAKPVTVVMKRAIRDEKATKTWQQVLAGNSVRHRKFKFHLQAENARREHAANVIQSNWKIRQSNKAGKALRKTCRQLRTKAVKADQKEKATEEVRDQRKKAFRHATKKMTFVRELHANKFQHAPEVPARQSSIKVPSLSRASTIQLSREASVEVQDQPAEEHHVTVPEDPLEAVAEYNPKAPKKRKNKARWLKAKTTARLEMLSRPVNKAELANKVQARCESENAKIASLGKPASRAQRTPLPKPLLYGQRGIAATKKWTRVIGRMAGGRALFSESLENGRSQGGFTDGSIPEEEDNEDEQGVETSAEGITAQFLKAARTFKEYDQEVDMWAEERKESLAIGMSNSSEVPSFLSRAGSDADSIKEMEDALKQAESDRCFLLMASAVRKTLAAKLAAARAEVEKQLLGSAEEAGAARRALLSVDQGGAPQEELPESSGSASGVHPGSSGAGPDDDVPGSIAIGLQQRTKSYEVASPRDKEEVKAMLREALSDRSVQDNSKRWWKKLADNHAPIRVLLGDVDAEELVPFAVSELQSRVRSRKTMLPAFGTGGVESNVLGGGQESHHWQDHTGRTVLRAQPAMVDSEGRPVQLPQAELSPMVDNQGRPVQLPQPGQTFMVDSHGRPVQLPQADLSVIVDSEGRQMQLPQPGTTFMVDSEGRQVPVQQPGQSFMVDSEGQQVPVQQGGQTFMVDSGGQQVPVQQGGQTFMVDSGGQQVPVQQGGHTFMVDSKGQQVPVQQGGQAFKVDSEGRQVQAHQPGTTYMVDSGGEQVPVQQGGQSFMVDSEGRQVQLLQPRQTFMVDNGGQQVQLPQPGTTYMVDSQGRQVQLLPQSGQAFMVDSQGRQVPLQQPGTTYMVDSKGQQVPVQQGGQTFMVDSEGRQVQVQLPQPGQPFMVDSEGRQAQLAQPGTAYIVDTEGRQVQLPQPGQAFMLDSEGQQVQVQLPQSGQAAVLDNESRPVQLPQPGQTFMVDSEGKQIQVQQSGLAAMVDSGGQRVELQLPQPGTTYMVDSEGQQIQVQMPQSGQAAVLDSEGWQVELPQPGQTFMMDNQGRPIQMQQGGQTFVVGGNGRPSQPAQPGRAFMADSKGTPVQLPPQAGQATLVDGKGRQHPQQGVMPGSYGGAHGAGYHPRKHNGSLPSLHPGNGSTQSDPRAARIGHNASLPQGYSPLSFSPATAPAGASQATHGITNPGLSRPAASGTMWGAHPQTSWQHGGAASGFYFPQPRSATGIMPSNMLNPADIMPKDYCVSGPEEDFSWGREGMASIWDPLTGKHLEQRRNRTRSDFYAARVRRQVGQSVNMRITPETRESQPCDATALDELKAKNSHWDLRSISTPNVKRSPCCPIPSFFAVQHTWAQDPMHTQHWGSAGHQQSASPMTGIDPRYLSSAPPGPGDAPGQLTNLSWMASRGQLGSACGTDVFAGEDMAECEGPQSNSEDNSDYESEEGSLEDEGLSTRPFRYIPDSGRGTRTRAKGHSWQISQASPRPHSVSLEHLEYGLSDAFKVNQKHMRARAKRHSHMQLPALLGGRHVPGQSQLRASVG